MHLLLKAVQVPRLEPDVQATVLQLDCQGVASLLQSSSISHHTLPGLKGLCLPAATNRLLIDIHVKCYSG